MKVIERIVKILSPGMKIKRWLSLTTMGILFVVLGLVLLISQEFSYFIGEGIYFFYNYISRRIPLYVIYLLLIILGTAAIFYGMRQGLRSVVSVISPQSQDQLVDLIYEKRTLDQGVKLVVIGGGTGLSTLLRGLKQYTSNIVAVVNVSDDGGSSGRLRKELKVLPPGDIRNCLVALSSSESLMTELFNYRFGNGDSLSGHSFGNLFLVAMSSIAGSFDKAIKESSRVLAIQGRVLPVTLDDLVLSAELEDGTIIEGESNIPQSGKVIKRVFFKQEAGIPFDETLQAIKEADGIILGPGSLFTSILPNLLVKDMAKTIKESKATKIYVCNVMTQHGETDNFKASDHLRKIYDHTKERFINYAVVNVEKPTDPILLNNYKLENAVPVEVDTEEIKKLGVIPVRKDLLSQTELLRHDPLKLADTIISLIETEGHKLTWRPFKLSTSKKMEV